MRHFDLVFLLCFLIGFGFVTYETVKALSTVRPAVESILADRYGLKSVDRSTDKD